MRKKFCAIITILLALAPACMRAQKFENLAKTPPMGWNSWNKFHFDINEDVIKGIADAMVTTGLCDAGYTYLNLDDGWHGTRDKDGFPQPDMKKFPSGLHALSDYIHAKGLKMGIYSDAGHKTCGGYFGSYGHEYQDALQYARWGVDYLKYDWCNNEDINPVGAYNLMRDALYAAGRPILFSMCEWGSNKPWTWAANTGHSWRTTGDITCEFDRRKDLEVWTAQKGVLQIIDMQCDLRQYAGPGHWNDADMLEVGNGMTHSEDRAHFSIWCMMASPLMLGNDLRDMQKETLEILLNKDVIAIDQDTLGIQGLRYASENGLEFWFKPLSGGDWAFCIFNRDLETKSYTIDWQKFNLTDEVSKLSTDFDKKVYSIRDLWSKKMVGKTSSVKKVNIGGHDVVLYRLTPRKK